MSQKFNANVIAIVGKPNVGKSSIFNRLVGKRFAIVDNQPGITRDRLYETIVWNERELKIIDTGGISSENSDFGEAILFQVEVALREAEHVFFVINGQEVLTADDFYINQLLKKHQKQFYLVINKLDHNRDFDAQYFNLGFDKVFAISALHGEGLGTLLDEVTKTLTIEQTKTKNDDFNLAIIGKANVGKSTLLNCLLQEKRAIVSDIPGTTRDSIITKFQYQEQNYTLVDTAGIIKKAKISALVEKYALMRSFNSLDEADLTLVLIDAQEPLNHFQKRIIGYADEKKKPIIIVINKWDLITKDHKTQQLYEKELRSKMPFAQWMPFVFISALHKSKIQQLLKTIATVRANLKRKASQENINSVILDLQLMQKAPTYKGGQLQIAHARQLQKETPTFILFVNNPIYMHFSYLRYIENKFRAHFNFIGCPLTFILKRGT